MILDLKNIIHIGYDHNTFDITTICLLFMYSSITSITLVQLLRVLNINNVASMESIKCRI